MPSALITGANRGLGLEFARQYLADGWRVYAAGRDPDSASELHPLADTNDHQLRIMALDVTDSATIKAAASELEGQAFFRSPEQRRPWGLGGHLSTRVCDLLNCRYPIVLAGMGGVARSELVTSVSNAGGFGFLGMVREPPSLIRQEVEAVRRATSQRFGVNLIPAATDSELLERQLRMCVDLAVPVVALFWELVPGVVERLRDAGVLVFYQVGSAKEGELAQRAGAHILIAQGVEAGGHVRGTTPLKRLLQEVIATSDVPVLASGGIVDGRDVAEAFSCGAEGVVIGTAFLASPESFAHDYHKGRIVAAKSKDTLLTDMFHINWPIGAPVRVLQNSATRGERGDPFGPKSVIGEEEARPIYLFSTDSPLRSMTGDFEAMALYAGQGVDKIDAIIPAGDRLRAIVAEAQHLLSTGGETDLE
jgi:nitronate monooxygenase